MSNEMIDSDDANSLQQLNNIYDSLLTIFKKAEEDEITTQEGSKRLAEERIRKAKAIKLWLRGIKGSKENTFATSAYIATSLENAFNYLCSLENLDEWTLFSRMMSRRMKIPGVELRLAISMISTITLERSKTIFFAVLNGTAVLSTTNTSRFTLSFFPPSYIEPGSRRKGVYFHWLSFVDPAADSMIMEEFTVHSSECRSLKAILNEKPVALRQPGTLQNRH